MAFTELDLDSLKRIERVISVPWGLEKAGKTSYALSHPAPIYYLDFDLGTEGVKGVREALEAGRQIYHATYKPKDPESAEEAEATLTQARADFQEACVSCPVGGTIVVDTSSQLWELIQAVKLDGPRHRVFKNEIMRAVGENREPKWLSVDEAPVPPLDYRGSNRIMHWFHAQALSTPGVNFCFVQSAKEVWAENKPTGNFKAHGWNNTPYAVQMILYLYKDASIPGAPVFYGRIDECKQDPGLVGLPLQSVNFELVSGLLFGAK